MIKFLFLFLLLPLEGFTQVSPPPVAEPPLSYRNIYKQEKNGIWGMTGQLGAQEETLIPFEYEYLSAFYYDWMIAQKKGKYGMINRKNQVVVPFQYDDMLDDVIQGYAGFKKGKKWGIINRKGEVSVPFEYDEITKPKVFGEWPGSDPYSTEWLTEGSLQKNNFLARKDGKYGIISGDGDIILPFDYQEIRPTSSDCNMVLKKNNKYAVYICYSPGRSQFRYDTVEFLRSNLLLVSANGKKGIAGHEDQAVLPLEYEDIIYLERNYYAFKKNGKYGLLSLDSRDSKMIVILPNEYDAIGPSSLRYAHIARNGKSGLFDYFTTKIVLRPAFESVSVSNSGQFIVQNNGLYGLCAASGKEIILPVYDHLVAIPVLRAMVDKVYLVRKGTKTGLIDSAGIVLAPARFDSIVYLNYFTDPRKRATGCKDLSCFTAIYKACLDNKIFLFNSDGQPYNETGVDHITFQNAYIRTAFNHQKGLLTITGTTIFLPEYEVIKIAEEAAAEIKIWQLSGKITGDIKPYIVAWKKKDGAAELFDAAGKKVGMVE
jgi:hypothetical protein